MSGRKRKKRDKKYYVKYKAECGVFSEKDLREKKEGGCDALVIIPIEREFPDDPYKGRKDMFLGGIDGYTKTEIPDHEVFEVFMFLASTLSKSVELEMWKMKIVETTLNSIKFVARYLKGRENNKEDENGQGANGRRGEEVD